MLNAKLKIFVLIFACQLLFVTQALSNEIRIAVASNFYSTMQEIIVQFELENIDISRSNSIVLIKLLVEKTFPYLPQDWVNNVKYQENSI